MVPKSWAVLSDALDEGCGHAARRVLELSRECPESDSLHDAAAECIRTEVLNAICERFHFDDPEEP
jgi:hypothetical protein